MKYQNKQGNFEKSESGRLFDDIWDKNNNPKRRARELLRLKREKRIKFNREDLML